MEGDHAEADHHRKNREETGSDPESGRLTGLPINSEPAGEIDTERCPL